MELPADLRTRLEGLRSLGVITGAGISAESGIPTYRGIGGIYADRARGAEIVESLSGPTLQTDPERTWRAIADLAQHAGPAQPNAGHRALVEIESKLDRFVLLTQNVDGLHGAAGSENVIPVHGSIHVARCDHCGHEATIDPATTTASPACMRCGAPMRPGVVLFGEMLPHDVVRRMDREFAVNPPEALLVVGTSALFPYIAGPVLEARRHGRLTIEVNPGRTDLSDVVEYHLEGGAGTYLPLIAQALR
ncbi:MAG: Sir2 family NAD-dependent protein deacetylase [Planctomycetota bacterium]